MIDKNRTFRIFVSSTFSDIKSERNALQNNVFPRLRDLAAVHGCRFQAIDLRWGVSEEAALDQQTMKICLDEIKRCQSVSPRPNFIILIGDRYGWRPLPYEIPADEFNQILETIEPEERTLVKGWYLRDDNNIPENYVLKSRTGDFESYENWEIVEKKLHSVLEEAARAANLIEPKLKKYSASATEQEIIMGALQVKNAADHVFCFAREMNVTPDDCSQAVEIVEASNKLIILKDHLKKTLGKNYFKYDTCWNEKGPLPEYLDNLCQDVYKALEQIILQEVAELEQGDSLDEEIAFHTLFRDQHIQHFVGREDTLERINNYMVSDNNCVAVIWGASGIGKTALIANVTKVTEKKYPTKNIVYRFIGATPDSSNARSLLKSLCMQITRNYGREEFLIPSTYEELISEFNLCLNLANEDEPLFIFLDALDQLMGIENGKGMTWLPTVLPSNVKLIISAEPGECLQHLEQKIPSNNFFEIKKMPLSEGKILLKIWLKEAGRSLTHVQKADLLDKFNISGIPLYLKLAFEEAKRWHSFDGLPKRAAINYGLGDDIPGIINDILSRLSKESNHGKILVDHLLSYLAAAKNGLSEDELIDILSLDGTVIADLLRRSPESPNVNRLPVVIFSRLFFDIKSYLTEVIADNSTLLRFFHRQFKEAVLEKYLDDKKRKERHLALAAYFEKIDINSRKVEELPWHLSKAGEWKRIYELLSERVFFEVAWAHNPFDVQRYWAQVEANSQFQMIDAYKSIHQDHSENLRFMSSVADLLGIACHNEEASDLRAFLLKKRRGQSNPFDLVNTLNARGISLKNLGDLDGAMNAYKEAETILRNINDDQTLATILNNQGNILRRQEKFDSALTVLHDAEQIARNHKNTHILFSSLNAISLVYFDCGEYEKALTCIEEQKILCLQTGDQLELAAVICNQVSVLEKLWDANPEELLVLLRQESEIYREVGIRPKLEESLTRQVKFLRRQARSLYNQSFIQKDKNSQEKLVMIYREEERIWNELNNLEGVVIAKSNQAHAMALLGQSNAKSVIEEAYATAVRNNLGNSAQVIHKTMELVYSIIDQ